MAEYPPRNCGPCPYLAHFGDKQEPNQKSWLDTNTMPKPQLCFNEQQRMNETNLGVGKSNLQPNLDVNPVPGKMGEYMGGIPECNINPMNNPPPVCCLPGADPQQRGLIPDGFQICKEKRERDKELKGILKKNEPAASAEAMYAAVGRSPPDNQDPSTKPPVPSEYRPCADDEVLPCYLPQPQDALPQPLEKTMDPVGPWASGRVDWGPLSGLTGIRPVVDKYSVARYSEGEWRLHNKEALDAAALEMHRANLIDWNGRQCLQQTFAQADKDQEDNTRRLQERGNELQRWKCEDERAIAAAKEEIAFLLAKRHKVREAFRILNLQSSIAGECLERRTSRLECDLARDEVEEELIKENALINEIKELLLRTLKDIELQLTESKIARSRFEYDRSDKLEARLLESVNIALNPQSTIMMFYPGAVCFPENQSTPEFWEHFTRENVIEGEATRQRSVTLRNTVDNILTNAARDLRTQADRVETALSRKISCNRELLNKLDLDLKNVLRRIADIENLIDTLKQGIRRMDIPIKKAQTRLANRMERHRIENCRDVAHFNLVDECKTLGESVAALTAQLNQAKDSQDKLYQARLDLEKEIMIKKKSLEIDCERLGRIRSFYPSTGALLGH